MEEQDDVSPESLPTIVEEEKKDDAALNLPRFKSPAFDTATANTLDWSVLWRGLWPSLLLCSNPSIHYTVFDFLKTRVLSARRQCSKIHDTNNLTMAEAFLVGLVAKLVATLITYPLIRAKIMLMVNPDAAEDIDEDDDEGTSSSSSLWGCLRQQYQHAGFRGLYKGCSMQVLHTVLKSALLMMVRERVTRTTHRFLLPGDHK